MPSPMHFLVGQSPNPIGVVQANSPAAWFRFGVGITVTGAGVSQWSDQSGNARHLLQAVDAARPPKQTDGSILFDGTAQFLKCNSFTLNQPETLYILGKQVTWTLNDCWTDGDAARGLQIVQTNVTPLVSIDAGATILGPSLATDTYAVIAAVFNGASSGIQINNGAQTTGNASTNNGSGFNLGTNAIATSFANIQVKEVILFPTAHDADTRTRIIRYLAAVGSLAV